MRVDSRVKQRVLAAVATYRREMAGFIEALVAVPTENPPGRSYEFCAGVIEKKLREIGLPPVELAGPKARRARSLEREGGTRKAVCLGSFFGTSGPVLYFHGHYDVVPASRSPGQFRPRLKGRNLFGRGAADMKGGLAAMIYAVRAIRDCGFELGGRIGLVFVPDEETGGRRGSEFLVGAGLLGRDGLGMLTAEPTSGAIWNSSRGAISLRVTVKGKSAHVGLHYRGVNAFEGMLAAAGALTNLKRRVEAKRTAFPIRPRAARSSILLLGGACRGGTSFNTVPAECSFTVDRRLNPEEDLEEEKAKLLRVFEMLKGRGIELEVEILQEGRSAGFPESGAVAQALARSVRAVTGKRPVFEMCPGLLEIRFYAEKNVPAFAYGPGLLSVAHGPNEYVNLQQVANCAAVYALTALELLGR